jgi:hypothetical protein
MAPARASRSLAVSPPLAARAMERRARAVGGCRAKQRFVRVDVPHAADDVIIHQRELDRRAARARRSPQVGGVERRIERLGAKRIQQRLRRSTRSIVRPRMRASRSEGTGQRNRESYTSIRTTRRPVTCRAIPRRVVSTSGSSGILGNPRSTAMAAGGNEALQVAFVSAATIA